MVTEAATKEAILIDESELRERVRKIVESVPNDMHMHTWYAYSKVQNQKRRASLSFLNLS